MAHLVSFRLRSICHSTMSTLRMGNLLLCMSTDLARYLPVTTGVFLQFHKVFRFVLHQEVEDNALQSLVEKFWMLHLFSITIQYFAQYMSPMSWLAICSNRGSNS